MTYDAVVSLSDAIGKPFVSVDGSIRGGPKLPLMAQANTFRPGAEQCTAG
jgi:hypothetical protein